MSDQQDTVHVEFFGSMALHHSTPTEHSIEVSKHQLGLLGAKPCPTCRDDNDT